MRTVHFITATNRLTAGPTLADVARELDIRPQTLRQARLDPESGSYRRPPEGWQNAVARVARRHAAELVRLAEQLEREG
jgi:hypothetical protein